MKVVTAEQDKREFSCCFLNPDESIFYPGLKPKSKSTSEYLKIVTSLILTEYKSFLGNASPVPIIAILRITDEKGVLLKDVCIFDICTCKLKNN